MPPPHPPKKHFIVFDTLHVALACSACMYMTNIDLNKNARRNYSTFTDPLTVKTMSAPSPSVCRQLCVSGLGKGGVVKDKGQHFPNCWSVWEEGGAKWWGCAVFIGFHRRMGGVVGTKYIHGPLCTQKHKQETNISIYLHVCTSIYSHQYLPLQCDTCRDHALLLQPWPIFQLPDNKLNKPCLCEEERQKSSERWRIRMRGRDGRRQRAKSEWGRKVRREKKRGRKSSCGQRDAVSCLPRKKPRPLASSVPFKSPPFYSLVSATLFSLPFY